MHDKICNGMIYVMNIHNEKLDISIKKCMHCYFQFILVKKDHSKSFSWMIREE